MMSLFSSFDLFFFHWQKLILLFFSFYLSNFIFLLSSVKNFLYLIHEFLMSFFLSIKESPKMIFSVVCSIFWLILFFNFLSVNSYIFALNSQVSLVLSMSLTFWLSFIMISISKNFKTFFSHLVPSGTPLYLTWFLFIIELISNFIRFITLTVRLTANIMSGHLLMILLSKVVMKLFLMSSFFIVLNMVEFFVSLIQSYIFCTMLILYFSEI